MDKEEAMKNAEASLRMEGFSPSTDMEDLLRQVLDGDMAEEEYLTQAFRRAKGSWVMAYSLEPLSDGCYPGTAVLINKLDIRDDKKLAQVEADVTKLRIAQWEIRPLADTFDFEHWSSSPRWNLRRKNMPARNGKW